jgi:catechol 2,3-dioxygenase
MIDWYAAVIGGKIIFQSGESTKDNPIQIAYMSNDSAPFRIGFMGVPGLHHMAFEYDSFDDLMSSVARLKQLGIEPIVCLDHGLTVSLYYSDPDQNAVELQAANFDWDKAAEWMRTSEVFRQNPIGAFFDSDAVLAAYKAGATFEQLQKDIWAEKYPPSKPVNMHLPPLD